MSNYKSKLKHITTFIFDYDGVLTDGTVIISKDGELIRTANVKDGFALKHATDMGYRVVIISGGKSDSVRLRFIPLGIKDVFLGVSDKLLKYNEFVAENHLKDEEVIYMGDDLPDYPVMNKAGVAACPADAVPEIKNIAHYISHCKGGEGCARDVIEQVMKVQGKWFTDKAFIW